MSTMIDGIAIREDDLSGEATRSLVRLHLEGMRAHSPPGSVFALDHSGLTGGRSYHQKYSCNASSRRGGILASTAR